MTGLVLFVIGLAVGCFFGNRWAVAGQQLDAILASVDVGLTAEERRAIFDKMDDYRMPDHEWEALFKEKE